MCQASPGPRCFNDSNKRMVKLQSKLSNYETELNSARKELIRVAKTQDFTGFSKIRGKVNVLEGKVNKYQTEIRHTQRDIDSTLSGRKVLEEAMKQARTKSELDALEVRRRTSDALRFNREHALDLKKSGFVPPIRFTISPVAA